MPWYLILAVLLVAFASCVKKIKQSGGIGILLMVRSLISEQSELLKQGIAITGGDYRYNIQFDYTALNEIKPQMIEEATKNACEAAMKFAKDSDSELGKIRRAYQGQFSIENRDVNTSYIKRKKGSHYH